MEFLLYMIVDATFIIGYIIAWIVLFIAIFKNERFLQKRVFYFILFLYVIIYSVFVTLRLSDLYNDVLWIFYGSMFLISVITYLKGLVQKDFRLYQFSVLLALSNLVYSLLFYRTLSEMVVDTLQIKRFDYVNQFLATCPSLLIMAITAYLLFLVIFNMRRSDSVNFQA